MRPITGKNRKEAPESEGVFTRRRRRSADADSGGGGGWPSVGQALRGRNTIRGVGLGLLGLVMGYLIATQFVFPAAAAPTGFQTLPDLRGMDAVEAEVTLGEAGLEVRVVDTLLHPSSEAGTVIGQSPLPGQLADASTEVRLTVSAGAQRLPVPEVVGVSLGQAVDLLGASGFGFQADTVESDEPSGRVVASEPAPGGLLAVPGTVSLQVSAGPPPVTMPQLVGLDEEEARTRLDSLGLELTDVQERFRFGLDQGEVIEQEPAAGVTLDVGSAVRLVVGRRGGGT